MEAAAESIDEALARARGSYEQGSWADAYRAYVQAEREGTLQGEDLEKLALAAYLTGRDDDYVGALERAHHAHLEAGEAARAVRCAFWLGFRVLMRGEAGRANGWFSRAERLLKEESRDCAERGLLLLPVVEQHLEARDFEAAYAAAGEAAAIGERCGDAELVACARHQQGRIRLQEGRVDAGLALLDETMLAVTSNRLSPLVTGLMYCSVIDACQRVYAVGRSREWTAALAQWCDAQPDMVAFAGVCQVHRAEVMQMQGAWPQAIEAARRAHARAQGLDRRAAAAALYQQAEMLRLTGGFDAAEEAYRGASRLGLDPQPGFALLRLAQRRIAAAVAAIRRAADGAADQAKRLSLLPACVEILLAAGETSDARRACQELEDIARTFDTGAPGAMAAQARGAVELAEGDAQAAQRSLLRAAEAWRALDAPYAVGRVRVLMGLACRALGDEDGAGLELDAARAVFERLGAGPELARTQSLLKEVRGSHLHGLTRRELQVLRQVASGDTNKVIAARLSLSEKTIDRHVSNIFGKLGVASRAAATAFAYRHKLI
jgi:DNA-binding CsgD family transcriptional regulator